MDSGLPLTRIRPQMLRQEVLDALRNAILSGEIGPGTRLREVDVATRMAVSRAPVREALRQLEQEGLIEIFPYRGAVVIGVSPSELDAAYQLRAVIESTAIRRACEFVTEEQLATLGRLVAAMRQGVRRHFSIEQFAELDIEFHDTILSASGYRLLRRLWKSLDEILRVRSFYQAMERGDSTSTYFRQTMATSHELVLEPLIRRDPDRAARAARDHILEVVERVRPERDGHTPGFGDREMERAGLERSAFRDEDTQQGLNANPRPRG